jgi:hypothetical protein
MPMLAGMFGLYTDTTITDAAAHRSSSSTAVQQSDDHVCVHVRSSV